MIKGYYSRIAAFLSEYVQMGDGGPVPPDPAYIRAALTVLVEDEVFSIEEIKRYALQDYDVIIREDLFPKEGKDKD